MDKFEIFEDFVPIEQFEIILDANIVIRDIMWMAKRKKEHAKTELLEILHSKTIIAQAPNFLKIEVEKHLLNLSEEKDIELARIQEEWENIAKHITFYDITVEEHEKENVRDHKDLAYIKLQEATGANIYSRDKDIAAMGGSVIQYSIVTSLRDYSRNAAVEYTLKIGGVISLEISKTLFALVAELIQKVFSKAKNLPKWVYIAVIGMLIFILVNEASRDKFMKLLNTIFGNIGELIDNIIKEVEPLIIAYEEAQLQAIENLEIVKNDFK
jgi:predicted nucleic acid-binding protein